MLELRTDDFHGNKIMGKCMCSGVERNETRNVTYDCHEVEKDVH